VRNRRARGAVTEPDRAAVSRDPDGPAVLIVDDDPDLLALLGFALRKAGLRTIEVATAEEALATIAAEPVGCVVADLRMPGMDGIDLVRSIRGRPETSTLPFILMTGYVGGGGAIEALEAGADDYLVKVVGLQELVARVQAHLRTQTAWTQVVVAELHTRASAIQAMGQLSLSSVPEEAAKAVVMELAQRIDSAFVGVYRLAGQDRLEALATWSASDGLLMGGPALAPARSGYLVRRAREGPWAETISGLEPGEPSIRFRDSRPDLAAGAPIYAGEDLVGFLGLAVTIDSKSGSIPVLRARLLASAIDYASVLGVIAGPAIADRRQAAKEKAALREVLANHKFFPVFQPIVSLGTGSVVGYEALTRFIDGTPPSVRFARATAVGVGFEFELAAIEAAIADAPPIDAGGFLSLNVSPGLVTKAGKQLRRVLERRRGRIVLELTEHAPIENYEAFRWAVAKLTDVDVAVDDAGAGYASLRHILELGPAWVKLDITLVRGIDTDPLRQALVAGLAHFATRSGEQLIAEGVERQEEADTLLGIGVEFAQGHLFGRPERGKP
jgi:EAL domain-containing protein (putative c-di-GMP-specific phosphodiesterase class I)/DNA-binding response OmpR family regulator